MDPADREWFGRARSSSLRSQRLNYGGVGPSEPSRRRGAGSPGGVALPLQAELRLKVSSGSESLSDSGSFWCSWVVGEAHVGWVAKEEGEERSTSDGEVGRRVPATAS